MAQQINYHPLGYGNEHGEIRFGHIIKNNKYGAYLRSGSDKTHYMNFQSTGNVKQGQKNSTHFYSPGSFTINCGEDIQGVKNVDGGKRVNPLAFNLLSQHGDIRISAPLGTIKLDAQNIELIATGSDGKNGNIKLNSNQKVVIRSPDIEINSTVSTKIFSEGQLDTIGKGIMNVYGGLMDFADGATALLGSKSQTKLTAIDGTLSSTLEDMMRTVEASVEAKSNELNKIGGQLQQVVEEVEEELGETLQQLPDLIEGELGEQLTLFEKDFGDMSGKLSKFFKENS